MRKKDVIKGTGLTVRAIARDPKNFVVSVGEAFRYLRGVLADVREMRAEEHLIRDWSPEHQVAFRKLSYDARLERVHGFVRPARKG